MSVSDVEKWCIANILNVFVIFNRFVSDTFCCTLQAFYTNSHLQQGSEPNSSGENSQRVCLLYFSTFVVSYINNNNNARTMFMVLSSWPIATVRVHPVHLTNVVQRREAADPPTKPTDLGVESACIGCYMTCIHRRHIIITQPKGWCSFHCPMEGGRLSQPRHTAGVINLPKVFTL